MTGKTIFKAYDRAALDAQYNNRARHADHDVYFRNWEAGNKAAQAMPDLRANISYGPAPEETLDIFLAGESPAPVHVFIHGGYWQQRTKDDFSFVAQGLVPLGAHTVVVNYALAPQVTMDEIVRQNRAAFAWIWRNARDFGGDPDRIFVSGHSAGGHLVAMVMSADWTAFGEGLPPDLIKGGCAISGLYDLEPIRLTYLNDALGLDAEAAARNSPVLHPPIRKAPIIVAVGAEESEEYHRQAEDFVSVLTAGDVPCEHFVLPGLNHYSVIDQFMRPDTALSLAVGRQMGL